MYVARIAVLLLIFSLTTVQGLDYQPGSLTFPLTTATAEGDVIMVPLMILGDEIVEGPHSFTVDVVGSYLVVPWSSATVTINDDLCEY